MDAKETEQVLCRSMKRIIKSLTYKSKDGLRDMPNDFKEFPYCTFLTSGVYYHVNISYLDSLVNYGYFGYFGEF